MVPQNIIPHPETSSTHRGSTDLCNNDDGKRSHVSINTQSRQSKRSSRFTKPRHSPEWNTTHHQNRESFPNTSPELAKICRPERINQLRTLLAQVALSQKRGLSSRGDSKHRRNFDRWGRYLRDFGINDPWLDQVSQKERNHLICSFVEALQRNKYGTRKFTRLRARTVSSIIGSICSTFWSNFRDDPCLNSTCRPLLNLKRQYNSYNTEDPAESHRRHSQLESSKPYGNPRQLLSTKQLDN